MVAKYASVPEKCFGDGGATEKERIIIKTAIDMRALGKIKLMSAGSPTTTPTEKRKREHM